MDEADRIALETALAAVRDGDHGRAARFFARVLARHPDDVVLRQALASAQIDAGRYADAVATLAGRADPTSTVLRGNALAGLGDMAAALAAFEAAPDETGADRGRARALEALDRHAEAAAAFQALDEVGALASAARCLARAGDIAGARALYHRYLAHAPADAAGARLQLRRLEGEAIAALPVDFVRAHFESFATSFDHQLRDVLGYAVPEPLAALLLRHRPVPGTVLDLGCGTGLMGPALGDAPAALDGIDLSPAMLARAGATGRYRMLWPGDVATVMADLPPAGYDSAVIADALIYVGDPTPWLAGLARLLRPGGAVALSLEAGAAGYALHDGLRYRHAPDYMAARAAACGLREAERVPLVLRREANHAVDGWLLLLLLD